jgi:hypothetical protein
VKLDLLYEFQPKVKPWDKPHPYGQRDAEQSKYFEGIEQIPARRSGWLQHRLGRRAPLPRRSVGLAVQ